MRYQKPALDRKTEEKRFYTAMKSQKTRHFLPLFALLATLSACGGETAPPPAPTPQAATPAAAPAKPAAAPAKPATTPAATFPPGKDPFELAEDKAASATSLSQSSATPDDWKLVESRWQEAIVLMKQVPTDHPKKAQIKKKLADYQKNLNTAKQKTTKRSNKPSKLAKAKQNYPLGGELF
ncbi:hypothetical protein NG798_10660 [Ancylothrix sp. C2]|uniref:hypothetical protein n=1 Tax=Ancylothrix sp. D3o TaxID=2953691 RepID=UPI0021BAA0F4|nr:hypothetical protein [Ancylothrix sp. D3o]MCT7950249.1 hypothetical protein [Ancylothrix sp. D3o]